MISTLYRAEKEEMALKKKIEKMKKLSLTVKIQLIIALSCSAAVPVYAWFAHQDRIEVLSKINEPPSITLASGGDDPALYITLENIDVSSGTEKYVLFSVEPGKYSAYDIQLTHTTNIPFRYELYRVMEDENGTILYTDHTRDEDGDETELHYSVMTGLSGTASGQITLTDINPDNGSTGRTLGDETDLAPMNRTNYSASDSVNQYVKPIYSVARRIPQLNINEDGNSNRDYFAIRITWTPGASNASVDDADYWNYAFNNKETDLIYISAKQNTYEEP